MIKKRRTGMGIFLVVLMSVFIVILGGCGKEEQLMGSDTVEDGTYLLTVDGYGVTEDEFLMFLRDQKAVAANYFWVNYEMQPDDGFWEREIDGMTPNGFAKERALEAAVQAKEEFILASERGILEYQDYNGMMDDMEAENAQRADKKESGDAFYGISEFTPFTYYQYLNGNIRSELEHSQEKISKPTKAQLLEVYEANKENLTLGTVFTYTIIYADGTEETVSQNTREIGKEDSTTEDLIYNYFAYMEPGDSIREYSYRGEAAEIILQSAENLGYMSFEDAKEDLRVLFARNELAGLIAERTAEAEIIFDHERYDALAMP